MSYFVALRFQCLFTHISLRLSRGRAFTESSSCVWHVAKFLNIYDQQAFILFKRDNSPLRQVLRNLILQGVGGVVCFIFSGKERARHLSCQEWQDSGRTGTGTWVWLTSTCWAFANLPERKGHLRCSPKMQLLEARAQPAHSSLGMMGTAHLPQGRGPWPSSSEAGGKEVPDTQWGDVSGYAPMGVGKGAGRAVISHDKASVEPTGNSEAGIPLQNWPELEEGDHTLHHFLSNQ